MSQLRPIHPKNLQALIQTARLLGEREEEDGRAWVMAPGEAGLGAPIEDAREGPGSRAEEKKFKNSFFFLT